MHIPILFDIVIILGLATLVSLICQRLNIPSIVGFLVTGALIGPFGFSFIKAVKEVEVMAEIGVILLLFTIGLEFSLEHLLRIKRAVLIGGSIQVFLTAGLTLLIAQFFGLPLNQALFVGFLVALSSTAIVLNQLQKMAALDAPHGKITLGILIFQDIIIVPFMIITPFLAGAEQLNLQSFGILFIKIIVLLALIFAGSRWFIPKIFFQVAKTQNREMFLMTIVFTVFAIAWITSEIGLSLALGAFMAGLMISESEYSHDAISHILPFRDIFISFFFVSVGMLLDFNVIYENYFIILMIVPVIFILKGLVAFGATLVLGYSVRIAVLVGFALFQIGEFSFILSKSGFEFGLLSEGQYQVFLAITVITMIFTPFMIRSEKLPGFFSDYMPLPKRLKEGRIKETVAQDKLENHLIIIGFGVIGRNVAHAARAANIPYTIMELNPETVKTESLKGEPIHFGDAGYPNVLKVAGAEKARIMVIAISDIAATRRTVFFAKLANPNLYVIARARYVTEIEPLRELGADDVIAEEFEASIEVFTRVLHHFEITAEKINILSNEVRLKGYEQLRQPSFIWPELEAMNLPDVELRQVVINENCELVGKTVKEVQFRQKFKLNLIATRSDNEVVANPSTDYKLKMNDRLFVLGTPHDIAVFLETIDGSSIY